MEQHDLIQGTPEWHQYRATHLNASDAPAMMGCSPYKSRTQLMDEMVTGITPEVDDATQRRFDDGHRFEDLARPLAEKIIGKRLYRVTGSEGKLSASFDGLTADDEEAFEHKSLNDEIRACFDVEGNKIADLPLVYRVQMEQQSTVSGCKRVLFMASKFNAKDELIEERHCWYYPDMVLREQIIAGWAQLETDLKTHQPTIAAAKPKAEAIQALPSVFVQATGMVTASNLSEFKEAATAFIANIKTELVTDQDFADAESTVKFCKDAEGNLEATKASVLAQMSTVNEVVRTLDHIAAQLRDKRLTLDKLVKSEKEARKLAIVSKAANDYTLYIDALEAETKPIRLNVNGPSFAEAIKGLKSLASMQEKVDTALRDAKFAADTAAKDVRSKLAWCKTNAAGHHALFPDLQALMAKPMEDFTLTITSRIEKQKADEAARLEAERARMEAEAKVKAEREAAAKLEEETARIRAEEQAKARAELEAQQKQHDKALIGEPDVIQAVATNNPQSEAVTHDGARPALVQTEPAAHSTGFNPATRTRASRAEILEVLSENFGLPEEMMLDWIIAEFAGDIQFELKKAA